MFFNLSVIHPKSQMGRSYPFMGIWYPSFVLKSGTILPIWWVQGTHLRDEMSKAIFTHFWEKQCVKFTHFFSRNLVAKKSIFFHIFGFFSRFFLFFVFSLLFHSILRLFTGIVFFHKFVLQIFHKLQYQLLGSNSGHLGACHRS
jgi:hypothetical protein